MKIKFLFELEMDNATRVPVTMEYDAAFYGDDLDEDDASIDLCSLRWITTDHNTWVNPRFVRAIHFIERTTK